jgi:hypothetical protein
LGKAGPGRGKKTGDSVTHYVLARLKNYAFRGATTIVLFKEESMSLRRIALLYLMCALMVRSADKPKPAIIQVNANDMEDPIIPAMMKAPSWDTLRQDFAAPTFRNAKTPGAYRLEIMSSNPIAHMAILTAPEPGQVAMCNYPSAELSKYPLEIRRQLPECAEKLAAFLLKTEIKRAAQ